MAIVPRLDAEDERYRFAYDEAVRTVEAQQRLLDELRGRATGVLTIGVAITAFLGGFVLNRSTGRPGVLDIVGIAAFATSGLCLGLVLWPWGNWKFLLSAKTLIDGWIEGQNPASDRTLSASP